MTNLKDPISSVRQGAALSLATVTKTFPERRLEATAALVKEGLKGIKDQPEESLRSQIGFSIVSSYVT